MRRLYTSVHLSNSATIGVRWTSAATSFSRKPKSASRRSKLLQTSRCSFGPRPLSCRTRTDQTPSAQLAWAVRSREPWSVAPVVHVLPLWSYASPPSAVLAVCLATRPLGRLSSLRHLQHPRLPYQSLPHSASGTAALRAVDDSGMVGVRDREQDGMVNNIWRAAAVGKPGAFNARRS